MSYPKCLCIGDAINAFRIGQYRSAAAISINLVRNAFNAASNVRPRPHQAGGAVREGTALLQGVATCGHCGRRLRAHYRGRNTTPGYHCAGKDLVNGRAAYCLNIGGIQIDEAVGNAVLVALTPGKFGRDTASGRTTRA
jgi:hypothetical protein